MRNVREMAGLGLLAVTLLGCVDDLMLPPPPPKESEIVHYWHFNNLPEGTLITVPADMSKLAGAQITYPGTGAGYMDRFTPGSDLNMQAGTTPGFALRPRNPAATRELLIVAPSTGYEKLTLSYAIQRSSNGAEQELIQYSVDGATWVNVAPAFNVTAIDPAWELKEFSLEAIPAVNNQANLRFRILFQGPAAAGASGNHRLDNFVIEGTPL